MLKGRLYQKWSTLVKIVLGSNVLFKGAPLPAKFRFKIFATSCFSNIIALSLFTTIALWEFFPQSLFTIFHTSADGVWLVIDDTSLCQLCLLDWFIMYLNLENLSKERQLGHKLVMRYVDICNFIVIILRDNIYY